MRKLAILTALAVFIGLTITVIPDLPRYFSFQDHIDPAHLQDDYQPQASVAYFNNQLVSIPSQEIRVLGDSDSLSSDSNKRIEVDLTTQHLYAYDNNQLIYNFVISSGKWDRTPTGNFSIWTKIRSQKMSGGSKELGTYYYLPNVPYILFFYNDKIAKSQGYSLHGTYWHNNFGVPMSHGCINMKTPDVAEIFSWAEVGTTVSIYGKYDPKLATR